MPGGPRAARRRRPARRSPRALSGHLCRCGAYDNILRAVADACAGRYDGEAERSPRVEAREKVTGAAVYTVDVRHEGQLEGADLALAPCARPSRCARSRAGARRAGVAAAVSLLDDDRMVTFVGQPIAAVAAADRKSALAALAAIKVDYEILPGVIGPEAARKAERADPVSARQRPEIQRRRRRQRAGVVVGQCARADFRLLAQEEIRAPRDRKGARRRRSAAVRRRRSAPGSSSTHASSRMPRSPGSTATQLTVHVSTQAVAELKTRIAKRFKLDPAKVRVIAEHVGGGFGSKAALGDETIAAVKLAQAARAPVKVAFDRHEELSVAGYRPAAEVKIALLPGRDGALKALSVIAHSDAGVAINTTVAGLARLIYPAEAKELVDYDVVSDLPPGCAVSRPGRSADGVRARAGD